MAINNKLPLHTRLGIYATVVIIVLLCFFLLRNCVSAVYYGAVTDEKELTSYYELGFKAGSKQTGNMAGQTEKTIINPYFLKEYRKGFREGRDSRRNIVKRENNEKK
ncbi:MAG: hypothetical protein GQ559_02665 [Desulfobulbaceae bacterium]|nr:hypothetical protein [Desulfobulbaceae bacterium]